MTLYRRGGKRVFDVVLAGLGMVVISPVLVAVAVAVRCRLGSPIFFVQRRPGLGDRPFALLKFRSMSTARNEEGAALPDGERLGSFGRKLRSMSLDELPEFWNVVRGDMSLVGPRPLLMEYLPRYTRAQRRRHEVRPGITGWAQINGRNTISWNEKFELDVWYVDNYSVRLDLAIIWRTVTAVFKKDGISAEGVATMPPFEGNA